MTSQISMTNEGMTKRVRRAGWGDSFGVSLSFFRVVAESFGVFERPLHPPAVAGELYWSRLFLADSPAGAAAQFQGACEDGHQHQSTGSRSRKWDCRGGGGKFFQIAATIV